MATPQSRSTEREMDLRTAPVLGIVLITLFVLAFAAVAATPRVYATQTKAQCRECCEKMGYDNYYEEQCKLKCFRDADHCKGSSAKPKPDPEPQRAAEQPKQTQAPRRPQPRDGIVFKWPNPLSLTPGKEQEAAAQILAVNGMPPNHPNYMLALRSIQGVLQNFVRLNPQGGKLPTDQLVKIFLKYRQQ